MAPIPSLLAVSAVHHHLVYGQNRAQTPLVLATGKLHDVIDAALLWGVGASALNPDMVFAIIKAM